MVWPYCQYKFGLEAPTLSVVMPAGQVWTLEHALCGSLRREQAPMCALPHSAGPPAAALSSPAVDTYTWMSIFAHRNTHYLVNVDT